MLAAAARDIVRRALDEDIRSGDITTRLTQQPDWTAHGILRARQGGVLAGREIIPTVYKLLGEDNVFVDLHRQDGDAFRAKQTIAEITGPSGVVLLGERVTLNFLQRLCGIATLTAKYVAAVKGTGVRIADTRKTTPGLRSLERLAVRCGGGSNHRFALDDCVMIKDNHIALYAQNSGVSRADALVACVTAARAGAGHTVRVLCEVESQADALAVAEAGADVVVLDNFPVTDMRACVRAVRKARPDAIIEATGGVTLRTVRRIAETGVDVISVGALTHSPPAIDLGLDIVE